MMVSKNETTLFSNILRGIIWNVSKPAMKPVPVSAIPLTPQLALQRELARRASNNPSYSLRAFARALSMSHTVLSLVLSGKRPLSRKATPRVAALLDLTPDERIAFVLHRDFQHGSNQERAAATERNSTPFYQISLDTFALLSDWYHYALLSLVDLADFKADSKWIAKRLGITALQAKLAFERLQRMALIAKSGRHWKQTTDSLKVDNAESTAATRKFHRQLLEKALYSLENDPAPERNFTCVTFAMDPKLATYAKERMVAFQRELMRELEGKASPKSVYTLTLQLFPLSRKENLK